MGQIVDLGILFFWERHAVVDCVEEGFVFLDQRYSFREVVVPFHETHCGVEGRIDDRSCGGVCGGVV